MPAGRSKRNPEKDSANVVKGTKPKPAQGGPPEALVWPRDAAREGRILEAMERMRRNRQEPPEWKREIVRRMDGLAAQPGALDFFRRHIRAAAANLLKHQEEDARAYAAALREAERMPAVAPVELQLSTMKGKF